MRRPFENEERQITMVLIVMIIERKLLLAMRGIIRVVEIEDNGGRGLGIAGDEVVHQGAGEPIEVLAVHLVLQTRERGGTRQVLRWIQGAPLDSEFEERIMAETVGVIPVRIA